MVKRVPTSYIVTRRQKRYIARRNMEKDGQRQFCKHNYFTTRYGTTRIGSKFSDNWKNFVEVA